MRAGDVGGCSTVEGTTVVWAGWTACRPASWEAQEGSSTRLTPRMRAVLRIRRIIPLSVLGSTPFAPPHREPPLTYSYRRASIGFKREALFGRSAPLSRHGPSRRPPG